MALDFRRPVTFLAGFGLAGGFTLSKSAIASSKFPGSRISCRFITPPHRRDQNPKREYKAKDSSFSLDPIRKGHHATAGPLVGYELDHKKVQWDNSGDLRLVRSCEPRTSETAKLRQLGRFWIRRSDGCKDPLIIVSPSRTVNPLSSR